MASQRGQRSNAPFTPEQETLIILELGALRNCLAVRRTFKLHYGLSQGKGSPKRYWRVKDYRKCLCWVFGLRWHDVEKCVRHIRDRAREPALPKSAANLKEGSTDWEWTGVEISETFYEMSKPNNEKYIILFPYFCSFVGLRFNIKKTFQQKNSVYQNSVANVWRNYWPKL